MGELVVSPYVLTPNPSLFPVVKIPPKAGNFTAVFVLVVF